MAPAISMPTPPETWNVRGSEWHRWDCHIHAPGTARNDGFSGDWAGYIRAIDNSSPTIRALGVTDYYSIDTYREVRKRKNAGELPSVQFVFPNVEMRFDVKTEKRSGINFHLLFSIEDENHEYEIERILGQLRFEFRERIYNCTRTDLIALGKAFEPKHNQDTPAFAEGVNQFKVSFTEMRELFRREAWLRENCLVAVAAGQDGTSGLQNDDAFTASRDEIQRFAHIIFSGQPADREFWLGKSEKMNRSVIEAKYQTLKPCLHGCDAHELSKVGQPDQHRFCWLKGDLAFETLRQAAIEPDERTWIGEEPPLPPTDSVTIDTIRPLETPWFENEKVLLNRGLVAIIGARGSGKTALVDLIAAGADALVFPLSESSFLRRATAPNDLIGAAKVEEQWRDGVKIIRDFCPPQQFPLEEPTPAVSYLSQQFVDRLCSTAGLATELREEIERVIFDQTDPTERYETESFAGLASQLLDPIRHQRRQRSDSVRAYSDQITDEQRLHDQLSKLKSDRVALDETLKKQRKELSQLIPKGKEQRVKRLLELEAACSESERKVERIRLRLKTLDALLAETKHVRDHLEPARFEEMKRRFAESELDPKAWEAFKQRFSGDVAAIIEDAKQKAQKESGLVLEGDPLKPVDLQTAPLADWSLTALRTNRDRVKKEVGVDAERQKKYDGLKRAITASETAFKKLDANQKKAEGANERRRSLMQGRRDAYREVFETFVEEQQILEQLYRPLQQQLEGAAGALGKLRLVVKRRVDFKAWVAAGENLLDLRAASAFRGHGALALRATGALLPAWRVGTAEEIAEKMHQFLSDTATDVKNAMPGSIPPGGRTDWMRQVGNWIYDSDHVKIEYGLEYDGNPVEQLSPGTRGIVLLLLYLAIDRTDRRPLLIDQPEENLDPQSVQDDLVPHFREARRRRQVIIVTHNANLVVNTDADQVIVATATPKPAGGLPNIGYRSGSLENPEIRHAVCDILEGGERAFLERERRYRLQWEQMLQANDTAAAKK